MSDWLRRRQRRLSTAEEMSDWLRRRQRRLSTAVREAKEFIERSKLVDLSEVVGTRASGALRRQSLELTRALADLRRREN